MSTVKQLILAAIQKHDGIANLEQIYSYVNQKMDEENKMLKDYKHTVRGIIYRLKKNGIIKKDDKTLQYKINLQ